ncbi:hypothetical protein [Candidatus Avelusimicrobium sp.]
MKRNLVVLCLFFCVSSFLWAEEIESVSLNPTRLGRFERLKISEELKTKDSLQTTAATLQSTDGVTIENAGNYAIENTTAMNVSLPQAQLNTPVFEQSGGQAHFTRAEVDNISVSSNDVPVYLKAKVLQMTKQNLVVTGFEEDETGVDFDGAPVVGLKLGNNDIPIPPQDCASLQWVVRTSSPDEKKHRVLGLVGCPGVPTCQDPEYAAAHAEICCKADGFEWVNGQCLRTCTGYKAKEKIETCGGPACTSVYSGMTQTDGSCLEEADSFWGVDYGGLLAKTGGRICETPPSYNATSYPDSLVGPLGLNCQEQFGYSQDGKAESCGFYSTSTASWPSSTGPFCVVGILKCTYTQKTWQCKSTQQCGQEIDSCI